MFGGEGFVMFSILVHNGISSGSSQIVVHVNSFLFFVVTLPVFFRNISSFFMFFLKFYINKQKGTF